MNTIHSYTDDAAAKAALKIRCSIDCTDDCGTKDRGWSVAHADGRFHIVVCHDTYSGDGFGAWWQVWDDFGSEVHAKAALAEALK